MRSRVVFVTLNVPGSNDDSPLTTPWTGAWAGNPEPRFTDPHPGYTPVAPHLTRIVVEGSTTVPNRSEYVRPKVDPRSAPVFSWERVDDTFAP